MVTLARKVLVPTILLGIVLATAVASVAWDAVRASHALERSTAAVRSTTAMAYALADAAQEEDRAVTSLSTVREPVSRARITRASERIAELESAIEQLELAPRPAAIWRQFKENRASLQAIRDAALATARKGNAPGVALRLDEWRLMTTRSDALLKDFAGYHLRLLDRTVAELQEGRMRALRATVVAAVLGLLVAVVLAVAVSRAVVRPIVGVAQAAQHIADTGRLSPVTGGDRDDEIGTLARSFNQMTERLFAANARLEDADRRKDDFLGMLSHELRNPLAPLRNSLYILDHSEPGSPASERARAVMNRQVTHLTRLVDDLLDVTRIARGKIELRRARIDLADLVRRCGEDHAVLIRERGHDFCVDVPHEVALPVDGDGTRLAQVIGNLLVNAAKFTPHGGKITLSARRAGEVAELRVRDTGRGIDPELLPLVFEPFTQAKQSLARPEGGLGLGLSLVRGIVDLHGGSVEAHSAGRGLGAEVVVRLPLIVSDSVEDGAVRART
ncbi:MAG TPA: ATP-binding protein [Anaeromyxobacter sp.]|nr:ATP-binding protein [Anaeromyxobacter sp.]